MQQTESTSAWSRTWTARWRLSTPPGRHSAVMAVTIPAQAPADRAGPSAARVRAIGVVEVLGDRLVVAIEDEAQHLRLSEHAHRLAEQPGRRLVRVDDDEEAVDTAADDAAVGHGDDRRR